MIEGLKITIKSDELKAHILGRADYHRGRAGFYESQVDVLKSGGLQSSLTSNDPVGSLERSGEQHVEKAAYFSFVAEHLVPDEEYILSEADLSRIELSARYF